MKYTDVQGHWGEQYIDIVSRLGLMKGFGDGTWRPDEFVTRAQLAKVLSEVIKSTPTNKLITNAMSSAVFISATHEQGGGVGSGCWISPWKVLTNAHVVKSGVDQPAEKIEVFGYPGEGFSPIDGMSAEIDFVMHHYDLALLSIDPPSYLIDDLVVMELADNEPKQGDTVWAIGNPFGQPWDACDGLIRHTERALNYWKRAQRLYGLSAPINPGNSGGMLINYEGKLIGVPSAGVTAANNLTYAIRLPEVKDFLERSGM